jgi:hypothetical protein
MILPLGDVAVAATLGASRIGLAPMRKVSADERSATDYKPI